MSARQFILDIQPKLIVDLFAGGGGMSAAMEMAWGRSPDIAINHDDDALSMHRANHPQMRHFVADVFEVDPRSATQGRPVGWLHLSPDCFPAGTMVLTQEGYRPIEHLEVGDEVLTHRLRWRKIISTMSTIRPLLEVRGQGHPGMLVSPEHPFYVRQRRDVWQTSPRGYRRTLQPAEWKPARELDKGAYWASPGAFPVADVPPVPVYRHRTLAVTENLLWLAGLYVADGWTRLTDTRAELVITCGKHEVERLRVALDKWPREGGRSVAEELGWTERPTGTAYQFTTNHRGLVEWLRQHFGHGASEKRIPGWALGMGEELRHGFLDGYLSGDGCRPKCDGSQLVICTTVSKALAFGLKALATSLGYAPAVYVRETQPDVIQGRKVNVLPAWSVRWRPERERSQSFFEDGMDWAPVREVRSLGLEAEVFNISVEDDESFVVDGVIVHNCTHHSQAAGGQPRSKKIRALAWVGYRWAAQVRPDVISLENVKQIRQWGPLVAKRDPATGRCLKRDPAVLGGWGVAAPGERVPVQDQYLVPNKRRAGKTWRHFIHSLDGLGYEVEHRLIKAANHGGHTTRERLMMIACCDGRPILWEPITHAKVPTKGLKKWRPAADCIDFSLPCQSIFNRPRPLAEATLRRIARGVVKFVLEAAEPFVINMAHGGKLEPVSGPMSTIATEKVASAYLMQANGGSQQQFVTAFLARHFGQSIGHAADEPLGTTTAGGGGKSALVECTLSPAHEAGVLRTAAFLMRYYGEGGQWSSLADPMTTITTKDRMALVTVTIRGTPYMIVDIGLRMLTPRELYRAQDFPENYIIDRGHDGRRFSKTKQVRMCGNSVDPLMAVGFLRLNAPAMAVRKAVA